ncbi:MAG: MFS transporter [Anaerolineales bacterium]|nr:MFS transporter [Anaerolineales bacterium]NUQ86115.1 MFS transporter [Anaerolineales bacterium]
MLPLTRVEQFTRRHLRHNVIVNLADGGFFGLALGFASFGTILPLFVASMTDSATLIGLVPAIHAAGWLLPQLFTANYIARLRRYKRTVLLMTIHERIPFLGFAIVALLLPRIGPQAGLLITFLLLTWQGLGGGFTANAWTSMISKIMPPEYRGTFFGTQAAVANLFISVAAVGAGYLLDWYNAPLNFMYCFLIATLFFTISWFALALTREPTDYDKVIEEKPSPFWQGAARILKGNSNFRWFLAARFLSQFATMGFSFYIIYALRRFNADAVVLGYLTATLTITQTAANVGMGWLGDRFGHRAMLILGAAAAMLSSLLAWFAQSLAWFFPVFVLAALANVSIWTNGMTMSTTFSNETERPFYIGLAQTLTAPATMLAPLLGGWIADTLGFTSTFGLSALLSAAMVAILFFLVKDPRNIPTKDRQA